jgi:hypothetical protein
MGLLFLLMKVRIAVSIWTYKSFLPGVVVQAEKISADKQKVIKTAL